MKVEIDIDSDMFDNIFRQQLVDHYFMISDDLKKNPHPDDVRWMHPVKDALYTLLTLYYSTQAQSDEFLEQVKEFENGC